MRPEPAGQPAAARVVTSAQTKLLVSLAAGIVGGAVAALVGPLRNAPLIGWDILAFVYGGWVWLTIWPLDPPSTQAHATREDPSRELADLLLLCAAIASLLAVGMVLFGSSSGNARYGQAALAVVSVFLSWTLLQTVFTLNYARLYYSDTPGGNQLQRPGTARLPRLRLPGRHGRDDVPGLRHQHSVQADQADGAAAGVAVVPAGRCDHRDHHQPGGRARQVSEADRAARI